MPERVRITDVAPRDGLQNEPAPIASDRKVALIERLATTGVDEVEITSFVRRDVIPQLADAEDVAGVIADFAEGVRLVAGELPRNVGKAETPGGGALPVFSALVPNLTGFERALALRERGLDLKIALFASASEAFSKRNTGGAIADVLARFGPVLNRASDESIPVRVYVSCAVACPFDGPTPPERVRKVVNQLKEVAITSDYDPTDYELDLADTIGVAHPDDIAALLSEFSDQEIASMTLHLHDTNGAAADCVRTALAMGVRSFDGAVGGLGGCPFASTETKRAPGNIDTGALVRTVHDAGYETGVDLALLEDAATFARALRDET
jgi:hydroxymethylglutaryl-CoA lyase